MLKLKINNSEVKVPEGISVMAAARLIGNEIPSLCYREGKPHFTSCMICMVKDNKSGKLFPSCSVKATEGMDITTRDAEIDESRKTALELMLSEHTGDCEAPCQVTCPAHMDIPLMNRHLANGDFREALEVVKKDIALPAVFGRVCPAPCEGACRRKSIDSAVSICLLKRYAGDHDLETGNDYLPERAKETGKKIAIIGAGPAGLAAAYYLQLRGHQCDIYDRRKMAGGTLWDEVATGKLPAGVLEMEVEVIKRLGAWFYPETNIDEVRFRKLVEKFDALLVTTGNREDNVEKWGLEMTDRGIATRGKTYQSSNNKIFAAGSVVRNSKLAIRTLGQGKEAAFSIHQYLSGENVEGEPFRFNSKFGKLQEAEIGEYLKETVKTGRQEAEERHNGFSREQVIAEAERCMHCDCRDLTDCKLRHLSDEYHAAQKRYWSDERGHVRKHIQHDFVIYEPNKCIKCGICVRIAEEHKEKFGLTFIGRGFDVVIGVPFGEAISSGLEAVGQQVVDECPTGALAMREIHDK